MVSHQIKQKQKLSPKKSGVKMITQGSKVFDEEVGGIVARF